ncbi:centaurin-gamma-1A-like protein [Dinothrombium tinctorium]|uniref:Centaurin-gamma-1A-like protein n=1 Tax=Dinothrombium tinctorium TaxID=1965070 RepID=A0A3S3PLN6_9ACAR|nr:centaurin-gamma-1A-like protein [Dinothrombium tinctorium]
MEDTTARQRVIETLTNNGQNKDCRLKQQQFYNNSLAIRQEIQRFESVHPSIYAIYDLLELVADPLIAQQIREHVVCIEDSFVNSQEWTLGRSVPDLRVGIVGSLSSGKSALVHRYLTGSYVQDESPEGGRFKKEVVLDGQSYMLLLRDEGGPPEMQFSCWVDAVILVFSLEDEASFNVAQNYYIKMSNFRHNGDIPIILVGTQDAISENRPRVIDEGKARKFAAEIRRCNYFETCATYGLNVERVFQEACQKIIQTKTFTSSVPSCISRQNTFVSVAPSTKNINNRPAAKATSAVPSPVHQQKQPQKLTVSNAIVTNAAHTKSGFGPVPPVRVESKMDVGNNKITLSAENTTPPLFQQNVRDSKDLPTPTSTPNTTRKTRRRSNLFPQLSNKNKTLEELSRNGELGSGRAIPVKQGYLYKKSMKPLNKEWKKKYVTLTADGFITYHPTLHDYMENNRAKSISLKHTTVKIPGQKPRGSRTSNINGCVSSSGPCSIDLSSDFNNFSLTISNETLPNRPKLLCDINDGDEKLIPNTNPLIGKESQNFKKRHRRIRSSNNKNSDGNDDSEGYEFMIVSLDNKQWRFEALNVEDRDLWVTSIEEQILNSLQEIESDKTRCRNSSNAAEKASIQAIRTVSGNTFCVDCDAPNPVWASLNLGALICIECSGIHRNLGTHISRVRSLDLDDWPPGHVSVMMALGNTAVNKIWEHNTKSRVKPTPNSSREEKERWIRAKYERKEFLKPLNSTMRIEQQLIDAVFNNDVLSVVCILAHTSSSDQINLTFYNKEVKTPLHLAVNRGNLAIVQLLIWVSREYDEFEKDYFYIFEIQYNADVKAIDADGKTALYYARIKEYRDIENLLLQNGCSETGANLNNGSVLSKKRDHIQTIPMKASDVFDQLPASII